MPTFRETLIKTFNRYVNLPKTLTNKRYGANFNDLKILGKDFTSKDKIAFLFRSCYSYMKKKGPYKQVVKFKPLLNQNDDDLVDSFTMDNSNIFNKNDKENKLDFKKFDKNFKRCLTIFYKKIFIESTKV